MNNFAFNIKEKDQGGRRMNLRESNWRLDWTFSKCLMGNNNIDRTTSCYSFLQDLLLKINIVMNDKCSGKYHEIYRYY